MTVKSRREEPGATRPTTIPRRPTANKHSSFERRNEMQQFDTSGTDREKKKKRNSLFPTSQGRDGKTGGATPRPARQGHPNWGIERRGGGDFWVRLSTGKKKHTQRKANRHTSEQREKKKTEDVFVGERACRGRVLRKQGRLWVELKAGRRNQGKKGGVVLLIGVMAPKG